MRGGWGSEMMITSSCIQNAAGAGGSLSMPRSLIGSRVGPFDHHQMMEARSPAPAWHHQHHLNTLTVKQEPADHDSSAYGSGSDGFHSSSPGGSDHNSRDSIPIPYTTSHHIDVPISHYYSTPVSNRIIPVSSAMPYQQTPTGFNPLTPPSFESVLTSPQTETSNQTTSPEMECDSNTTLTPCTTPPNEVTPPKSPKHDEDSFDSRTEDHLRRLQMAFERNAMLPESPKGSEPKDSGDEDGKSDYEMDEVDEQGLRVPRVNSHGKVKTFKCKQCEFVAVTKLDFWEHTRGHIKTEKLLTCPKCPFVTEYKHHLEYHLRNHFGSKPFKCDKCNYSCVNKSMLNSHLKSHSNIYQYRCADCTYATKYCHSLKLHLRKYKHSPAMVLNPDGTPNPLPIIDVYGTRRGPKQKSNLPGESEATSPPPLTPPNQHSIFPHFMLNQQQSSLPMPFPYGPLLSFPGALSTPLLFPQMQEQLSPNPSNDRSSPNGRSSPESLHIDEVSRDSSEHQAEILDLSKPEITLPINVPEIPVQTSTIPIHNGGKNRRKGRAFKLERIQQGSSDEDEIVIDKTISKVEEKGDEKIEVKVVEKIEDSRKDKVIVSPSKDIFNCQYCDIAFRDIVMYTMHMGYHGYKDPFTCNMCGEQSLDKVSFFLHIARTSHS